jgi:hypothetical protein
MNNIHLLAFGHFGTEHGFKQSVFYAQDNTVKTKFETFELNPNAITLTPESSLYIIRREQNPATNVRRISYAKYSAINDNTYIGNAFVFTQKKPNDYILLRMLNESHKLLKDNNTKDGLFLVNQSNEFNFTTPTGFDKIETIHDFSLLQEHSKTQATLLVLAHTNQENLAKLIQKTIPLLNHYARICFTDSVANAKITLESSLWECITETDLDTKLKEKGVKPNIVIDATKSPIIAKKTNEDDMQEGSPTTFWLFMMVIGLGILFYGYNYNQKRKVSVEDAPYGDSAVVPMDYYETMPKLDSAAAPIASPY